jgi:hypothetical protein
MPAQISYGHGHFYANTLSASGDIVGLDLVDAATSTIWLAGSYTGVTGAGIVFEISPVPSTETTNLNWFPLQMSRQDSTGIETGSGNLPDGTLRSWQGSVIGAGSIRARATASLTAPATVVVVGQQYAIEPSPCGTQLASWSSTSPAAASTVAGPIVTGLGGAGSGQIFATLTGATGGTLNIYLQSSPDGGTTWSDYAAFAQLAAGAAATSVSFTLSKGQHQTTITTVGTGLSPALTTGQVLGGDWGDRLRLVFKANASTSAGAAQVILGIFSA